MVVRKARLVVALVAVAMAGAAHAQFSVTGGEALLKALRENDNNAAMAVIETMGRQAADYRGYNGDTPLHIVVRRRDPVWVGFLLAKGANPNAKDKSGETPLIAASRIGFDEGARRLLGGGARIDESNRLGETALIVAINQHQMPTVRLLLERGANPDIRDHASGLSARDYARRDRRSAELLRLIDQAAKKKAVTVGPTR